MDTTSGVQGRCREFFFSFSKLLSTARLFLCVPSTVFLSVDVLTCDKLDRWICFCVFRAHAASFVLLCLCDLWVQLLLFPIPFLFLLSPGDSRRLAGPVAAARRPRLGDRRLPVFRELSSSRLLLFLVAVVIGLIAVTCVHYC
jgi:hypothetical protein